MIRAPLAMLCALAIGGCASLDGVIYVDKRFSPAEETQIREAATAWESATSGAWHVDLVFGANVSTGINSDSGRREMVRMTEVQAEASNYMYHPSVIGDTCSDGSYETITIVPDRLGLQTLRAVVMHEFGHHFGAKHIEETFHLAQPTRALMSNGPKVDVDRFVRGGCISRMDVTELREHVNIDGMTFQTCL